MEKACTVMRRLMWTLNDEFGGIGWGVPEAMGEIMVCHKGLAHIYIILPGLIIFWNICRCGGEHFGTWPGLPRCGRNWLAKLAGFYRPFLWKNRTRRFLACMLAAIQMDAASIFLQAMVHDTRTYTLFWNGRFQTVTLGKQAGESLRKIKQ